MSKILTCSFKRFLCSSGKALNPICLSADLAFTDGQRDVPYIAAVFPCPLKKCREVAQKVEQ